LGAAFGEQLAAGVRYDSIVAAREFAAALLGGRIEAGTASAKAVDEAVELGVIRAARQLVAAGRGAGQSATHIFQQLQNLYERQPNLNVRTSRSIQEQAYSTPAPIAFVMSELAGVTPETTVLEPTAGNGKLLLGADPARTQAVELNADRAAALEALGFAVTRGNALEESFRPADVVIANPPFGARSEQWPLAGGHTTNQIDHAIAWRALQEGLKPDGRAVLLIAGPSPQNLRQGDAGRKRHYRADNRTSFYYDLYNEFNVVEHVTLAGDLYSKQGASYPTDLVVISGRGKSALKYPQYTAPRLITSYTELGGLLDARVADGRQSGVGTGTERGGQDVTSGSGVEGHAGTELGPVSESAGGSSGVDGGGVRRRSEDAEGRAAGPGDADQRPGPGNTGSIGGSDQQSTEQLSGVQPGTEGARSGPDRVGPGTGESKPGVDSAGPGVSTGGVDGPADGSTGHVDPRLKNLDAEKQRRLAELAERMRRKLRGDVGSGDVAGMPAAFDPEIFTLGAQLGHELLQAGILDFPTFAQQMVALVGPEIGPHVKTIYGGVYAGAGELQSQMTDFQVWNALDEAAINELVRPVREEMSRPPSDEHIQEVDESGNEFQTAYEPLSTNSAVGTFTPTLLHAAIKRALARLAAEHPEGIEHWVADELGMPLERVRRVFSAEQVDALALAITQVQQGKGFIIGDQTGVGKGRFLAGMMQWARQHGRVPIFVTEKSSLYADMMRDLASIEVHTAAQPFRPLITNESQRIVLPDNTVLASYGNQAAILTEAVENVVAGHGLTAQIRDRKGRTVTQQFDAVFSTYSQFQTVQGAQTTRQHVLQRLAPHAMLLLDESHNAAGSKDLSAVPPDELPRALYVRQMIANVQGVVYSSATWAKRPNVMDLYFQTDLGLLGSLETLVDATAKGGVPLQQIMSEMLAEVGQNVRRERDLAGISIEAQSVAVDLQQVDELSGVVGNIFQFSELVRGIAKDIQDLGNLHAEGSTNIEATNFASRLHNVVDQIMLAMKVGPVVEQARQAVADGRKPFIVLTNTLESFLKRELKRLDVQIGQPVDINFQQILLEWLEKCRTVTRKQPAPKTTWRLSDEELGPLAVRMFNQIRDAILGNAELAKLPASPIDWLLYRLRQEGIKVGEITGRTNGLEYRAEGPPLYYQRPATATTIKGRQEVLFGYNGRAGYDSLDALIANQSGATGLSAHASPENGSDLRPRQMIFAQTDPNIDVFVQMMGRINRVGQVAPPGYSMLLTNMPAEQRPAAVLMKKLASLSANTTGKRESAVQWTKAPDFMNVVGDHVAADLMLERPDLHVGLGSPLIASGKGYEAIGAMAKVTGRAICCP